MLRKSHGRQHQRIELFRMAGITFLGHPRQIYQTRNISLTGISLTTQLDLPAGTPCSITLAERWSDQVFVMNFTGKVVRPTQDGLAIQFTEMALKPYSLLQTVLLYGSNNPLSLGQEFSQQCPFKISENSARSAGNC